MNSLDFNGVSLIGNIASISDIKTLPSGKKYRYFDICQNSKYKDKLGEDCENKTFFTVRLFEEQIERYNSIITKGKWIHIVGRLRNYLTENMEKKYYITADTIREMKPKEKIEIFDYDWLNDPDFDSEEDYGI